MKKLLLLISLLLATNAWTAYVSVETGEEVKVNDWVLIDEIQLNDSEGKLYKSILKYCSISVIVNETEKKPTTYRRKTTTKPIAAYGYVWFMQNEVAVQSFTKEFVFQSALTGKRDLTLPESCEVELEEPKP
jgi:hypothetical protein